MKKVILLFKVFLFLFTNNIYSSHMTGGEITWECLKTGPNVGKYIFQLKLYRDCTGIPFSGGAQPINVLNCPGVTTITVNPVSNQDLTPQGCGYDCATATFGQYGAVQVFVMRSAPVTLNGVPPAAGWIFYWDNECCRNNLDNVSGEANMVIRSKMYSYNGQNANPCFDSSPFFAEAPLSFLCIGYEINYNNKGIDIDNDSLRFGWDYALDNGFAGGLGTPLAFDPPYSVNSPIPGNPFLDALSGQLTINPLSGTPQGNFINCFRAEAYQCNQKIAEIFRETQLSVSNTCQQTIIGPNQPPIMNPPFLDTLGIPSYWTDTVYVGDTVSFSLSFAEYDINLNTTFQVASLNTIGSEFATNYLTSPPGDCNNPPCAYLTDPVSGIPSAPPILTNPPPFAEVDFFWLTSCDHISPDCITQKTHHFYFRLHDTACPVPARNDKTASITVIGPHITANGDTLSTNFPNGTLQWYMNGLPILGETGNIYIAQVLATYNVMVTLADSCQISSNEIITGPVAVNEIENEVEWSIYPVPAKDFVTVEFNALNEMNAELQIVDIDGKEVLQQAMKVTMGNSKTVIGVKELSAGLYIVKFRSEKGTMIRKLILD